MKNRNQYRRLKEGEVIQLGDYMNAKGNIKIWGNLDMGGWLIVNSHYWPGKIVGKENEMIVFYRDKGK
jgi:hypothetical protein